MAISQMVAHHVLAASVALLGIAAAGGKRPAADAARAGVTFDGLGPVKVGMPVEEAERALGIRLAPDRDDAAAWCHHVQNEKSLPGAVFMVIDGRIVGADVHGPGHRTEAGIQIGSTEDEVELAYPRLSVQGHPFLEEGHSLRVDSDDGARSIVFETDGEVVASFRAGDRESVRYVEGCE